MNNWPWPTYLSICFTVAAEALEQDAANSLGSAKTCRERAAAAAWPRVRPPREPLFSRTFDRADVVRPPAPTMTRAQMQVAFPKDSAVRYIGSEPQRQKHKVATVHGHSFRYPELLLRFEGVVKIVNMHYSLWELVPYDDPKS